jgi:small subunit ribosomal protein S1
MKPSDDDFKGDDEDFGALLAEYEARDGKPKRRAGPQPGDTVRGRVVSIGKEAVLVDLGVKAEASIDVAELQDGDGRLTVAVGDMIEARVVESDGRSGGIVLRVRAGARGGSGVEALREAQEHGLAVEGQVAAVVKGGLEVTLAGGARGFCPASQVENRYVEDLSGFVGRRLSFRITRLEGGGRGKGPNVVLSRRSILEEEARAQAEETRRKLVPGAVLPGRVTRIEKYGAFIDLGGLDGLLPVSEISFARVEHPRDVLAEGQEVEVQVLRAERTGDPKRPDKISLSLRALQTDPWDGVAERYPIGRRLSGPVVRVEAFGAFVRLEPGVEALLHVEELGEGRTVRHARELVRPGDTIEVEIRGVEADRRRISLGKASGDGEPFVPVRVEDGRHDTLGDLLKDRLK